MLQVKSREVFEQEMSAKERDAKGLLNPDTLRSVTLERNADGHFGFAVSGPVMILGHDGHDLHFVRDYFICICTVLLGR